MESVSEFSFASGTSRIVTGYSTANSVTHKSAKKLRLLEVGLLFITLLVLLFALLLDLLVNIYRFISEPRQQENGIR